MRIFQVVKRVTAGTAAGFIASVLNVGVSLVSRFTMIAGEAKVGLQLLSRLVLRVEQNPAVSADPLGVSGQARPAHTPALDVDAWVDSAEAAKPAATPAAQVRERVGKGWTTPTQNPALDVDARIDSAQPAKPAGNPAILQTTRISDHKKTQLPAGKVVQVKYDLVHRKGGTATDVGGSDDWAAVGNASNERNGTVAASTGELLNPRTRELQLAYADFVGKAELTVTAVRLHFFVKQEGTTLNNGDLRLLYDSGAGLQALETITANVDNLAADNPRTFDLFALGVDTWAELNALVARVEHRTAVGHTLIIASVDAVELEVVATKTEVLG